MTEARRSVSETAVEALDRARTGQTLTNYPAIFGGFMAKGIPEATSSPGRTSSRSRPGKPWGDP